MGGAQVLAGGHGDDHLPHGIPRTGAGVVLAPCSASRTPRGLTALIAGLAQGPSTPGAAGRLALLLGCPHTGPGRQWRRVWWRTSGDQARNGTYRQGEVCKAPMEEEGAKMGQCNEETNQLDKFTEIHTKLVRNSYEFRTYFVRI